jgi:hypothetical protein
MVQMYWVGVTRDVRLLLETMISWQKQGHADVNGDNEVLKPAEMRGFRSFVERAVGKRGSATQYV